MSESKIGDHAEFKDEDVEGHNERSQHAVTSRYNLAKLRRIGEIENELFEAIAKVMNIDADDLDIPLSIADALDTGTKSSMGTYLREQIVDACGDEGLAGEMSDRYLDELVGLMDVEEGKTGEAKE